MAAGTVNFASGTAVQTATSTSSPDHHLQVVHGWLAATGFGILIPIGIVIARTFKEFDPWWFHLHRLIVVTGVLLGVAGFGIGCHLGNIFGQNGLQRDTAHRAFGIVIVVLAGVQILVATFLRPSHDQKLRRRAFNLFHHWTGRIAAGFAIANVYVGLHLYDKWDSSPRLGYILYSVLLGVVVGVAILKESVDRCIQAQRSGESSPTWPRQPTTITHMQTGTDWMVLKGPPPREPVLSALSSRHALEYSGFMLSIA